MSPISLGQIREIRPAERVPSEPVPYNVTLSGVRVSEPAILEPPLPESRSESILEGIRRTLDENTGIWSITSSETTMTMQELEAAIDSVERPHDDRPFFIGIDSAGISAPINQAISVSNSSQFMRLYGTPVLAGTGEANRNGRIYSPNLLYNSFDLSNLVVEGSPRLVSHATAEEGGIEVLTPGSRGIVRDEFNTNLLLGSDRPENQAGEITIATDSGNLMAKIHGDGTVTLGEHYRPDLTARIFFESLAQNHPKQLVKDMRSTVSSLIALVEKVAERSGGNLTELEKVYIEKTRENLGLL